MKFTDRVEIAGTRRRSDGYLVADARVARTGIQTYLGVEVGRPEMSVVRVHRPESEVFSNDALSSFAHRPVTNNHPPVPVTADNWKQFAVGNTADEIARDGGFVRVPLMLSDAEVIRAVESGKRELSAGYTSDLDWTAGETQDGEKYDAVQRNIRINHVAVVARGRAGESVRIGDGASDEWGVAPITTDQKESSMNTRMVMVDGLQVETTEQGASAIEKLQRDNQSLRDANSTAIADRDTKIKGLETQIETKDGEIAALKKQLDEAALSPAKLSEMVRDRSTLTATASRILGREVNADLTDNEIRREVATHVLGDEAKDMSDAAIEGVYRVAARDHSDPIRDGLRKNPAPTVVVNNDDAEAAYRDSLSAMSGAWQHPTKKEAV